MDDTDALMGIGAFARRVGLAPSALRFYDDCAVLRPAHVDDTTGYRYYAPDQEPRALLIRRLREAGMPLTDTSAVLDGPHDQARTILEDHARKAHETAASAQTAITEILRDLAGTRPTTVRLGGAELASAVRQVAPAVATSEEFPVLGRVLVELDRHEVRLVATDRYRLAVRALRPTDFHGDPRHLLVDVADLTAAATWATRLPHITITADRNTTRLHGEGTDHDLPTVDDTFPDYRAILDALPTPRHRIITDRTALRTAIADHDGPLPLHADDHRLTVSGIDLEAICTGEPVRIAFDPAVLLAALDSGVGPDVLLEITSPTHPVVVRSADQGSFTTLVMPVHHTD